MSTKNTQKTRKLVVCGMLAAVSIVLGLTPLGYLQIGPFAITLMHLPTIIGAIMEGPLVGGTLGLVFGLTSMYRALTVPTLTSPIFYDPIVALVPRILVGLVAYYVFAACLKLFKNAPVSSGLAAFMATLTNTAGVLGLVYLLHLQQYAQALSIEPSAVGAALLSVVLSNGIIEAVAAVVICTAVVTALRGLYRLSNKKGSKNK